MNKKVHHFAQFKANWELVDGLCVFKSASTQMARNFSSPALKTNQNEISRKYFWYCCFVVFCCVLDLVGPRWTSLWVMRPSVKTWQALCINPAVSSGFSAWRHSRCQHATGNIFGSDTLMTRSDRYDRVWDGLTDDTNSQLVRWTQSLSIHGSNDSALK